MRHLSEKELSEVAAKAFTDYSQDNKAWLLVAPSGAMWASPDPKDLIKIINKEETDDYSLYQEA